MPSVMQRVGTPNPRHNLDNEYRKYLDNVDPELSQYNEVIRRKSVEEIYAEHLQPAFEKFNAKQKRKDRRLDVKYGVNTYLDYQRTLDKLAQSSGNKIDQKGRPPIREIVWQFGNPEQGFGCKDQTDEQRELAKTMLLEAQAEAELRYPQLKWGDLSFHADEVSEDAEEQEHGSLHLHSSFVPLCLQNRQGPEVQVAFERCLREMGFDSFQAWKHDLDNIMEEVLQRHGLERTLMDNHNKHMESTEFHRQQRLIRETKELEEQKEAARRLHEAEIARLRAEKDKAEEEALKAAQEAADASREAQDARLEIQVMQHDMDLLQVDLNDAEQLLTDYQREMRIADEQWRAQQEYYSQEIQGQTETLQLIQDYDEYLTEADTLEQNLDLLENAAEELPDAKRLFKASEAESFLQRMNQILQDIRKLIGFGIKRLKIYESSHAVDEKLSEPIEQRAESLDSKIFGASGRAGTFGPEKTKEHSW